MHRQCVTRPQRRAENTVHVKKQFMYEYTYF